MKNLFKVGVTLSVLAIALGLAALVWRDYLLYPWTRDGQVDAYVVGIAARVSAPMIEVAVEDNQWVNRGDLLFEIDPTDFKQRVTSAEASLNRAIVKAENLKREVERRRQLAADKLISLEEFQDFETQYAEAVADIAVDEAELELAKLDLSYTKVYATVDGYVTNLAVTEGTYVTTGQPLVALVDYDSFWVYGFFKETDLENIKPGDRAIVRFMGHRLTPYEGVVDSISWGIFRKDGEQSANLLPSVDPTVDWVRLAQRFPVRIRLNETPPEALMRVGRTASVMIYPGEQAEFTEASSSAVSTYNDGGYPKTLVDGRGDDAIIPVEPRRVISLAPSVTETLIEMGQGHRLIASQSTVTRFYGMADLPRLAVYPFPPFEALVALDPDLVLLADITSAKDVRRLRRLGIPALVLNSEGYDGVIADIHLTGKALNSEAEAKAVLTRLQSVRDKIRSELSQNSNWQPPRTVIFTDSSWQYAAGDNTFGDGVIVESGGNNIAADAGNSWPILSKEYLVEADPEVILYGEMQSDSGKRVDLETLSEIRKDPVYRQLSAVKNGRVYFIDSALLEVPGPRVARLLQQVSQAIQDN